MKVSLLFIFVALITATYSALVPFDDWESQRVALDDVNIFLRYAGSGPPLMLVHGFPLTNLAKKMLVILAPQGVQNLRMYNGQITLIVLSTEHSLTWHTIGPILAQNYTVIAVDIRGMGQSTIPSTGDYTSSTAAEDLKGVLDFLNINQTYIVTHDKGNGQTAALNAKYRSLVKRAVYSEYALPGFGYESIVSPELGVTGLYQNWQLAFFSVPDAAQYFIQGREKEMLAWYFWHSSYTGNSAISEDHLNRYTRELSKAGFLRSGLSYFATTLQDAKFFNSTFRDNPLQNPALVLGGESSGITSAAALKSVWGPVVSNGEFDIVPKAGHWLGDENPKWTARRIATFLAKDEGIPSVDLSYLKDKVTLS